MIKIRLQNLRFLSLAALLSWLPFTGLAAEVQPPALKIDKVFFAQHHVLEPSNPLFKLVGNLETLIKVQVYSEAPVPSPYVFAVLALDGQARELRLSGPERIPRKPAGDPVLMTHSYADSFTAVIPREWIRSGLAVAVELRDYNYKDIELDDMDYSESTPPDYVTILDRLAITDLKIGAPTKLVLHMFDVHFFGKGVGADFPGGWERELEAKLPVAELDIRRVRNIMFNEIVMPPHPGIPSAKYTSPEDFRQRTGNNFDGEQAVSMRWVSALKAASGRFPYWRPYHINIAGVHSGGMAGGFRSCANLHRHGVIFHELGHSFGLPHWAYNKDYPYKRSMYGADPGEPCMPNAGPTWVFDIYRREFIAPFNMVEGKLEWKHDPMHGGGRSREDGSLYRNFSDYSVHKMRQRLEEKTAFWNEELGQYAQWNQTTAAYDKVIANDGLLFPIERDVDVISMMVNANAAVPEANIIYPLIGPYKAGLVERFNADSSEDRKRALAFGYTETNCNVALRVTQGGKTTSYLMPVKVSPDDNPLDAFQCAAINLPAGDGAITKAELLYCPDLMTNGIGANHKLLCELITDL